MELTELLDEPEYSVEIDGKTYHFSELFTAGLARLQSWINANVPHPEDVANRRLDGLSQDERKYVIDQARKEARNWPPQAGSPGGAEALGRSPAGQIVTLLEGLRVHQPETNESQAEAFYRKLKRHPDQLVVRNVFRVIYGAGVLRSEPVEGSSDPKADLGLDQNPSVSHGG